jgi:hypothetical protein
LSNKRDEEPSDFRGKNDNIIICSTERMIMVMKPSDYGDKGDDTLIHLAKRMVRVMEPPDL